MGMSRVRRMGHWLWQAWPVWAIGGLAGLNISLVQLIGYDMASVHAVVGPMLQMVGGAFVLYFLNENMGVFNRGTLIQRIVAWVKSCPLRKKHYALHAGSGAIQVQGGGTAMATVARSGETIQERLEILEKRIDEIRKEMHDGEKRLRADLESTREQLRSEIHEKAKEIAEVRSLIATTVVGSVNPQFFGILLVLYGTALPLVK